MESVHLQQEFLPVNNTGFKLENKTILVISEEPWENIALSKHHYSRELAKRGNNVFYLSSPSSKLKKGIQKVSKNITVINYSPFLRGSNRLPKFLRRIVQRIDISRIKKLMKQKPDLVWSFDPYRFQQLNDWGAEKKIYHAADLHKTPLEFEIAKNADVVFSVSDLLLERFKDLLTPRYFINHGLAGHFIDVPGGTPEILPGNEFGFKVGLVGNIVFRHMDVDILKKIVYSFPEVGFYFIGPTVSTHPSGNTDWIKEISALPNTFFLGKKTSAQLPLLLEQFNAFLIPYLGKKNKLELSNSHKILEYLSTGKPVVTSYVDQYAGEKDLLLMAEENEQLPGLLQQVIGQYSTYMLDELVQKRKKFACSNSYTEQLNRIETIISTINSINNRTDNLTA